MFLQQLEPSVRRRSELLEVPARATCGSSDLCDDVYGGKMRGCEDEQLKID